MVDSLTYQKHDAEKFGESNYSLSLVNPDSSRFSKTAGSMKKFQILPGAAWPSRNYLQCRGQGVLDEFWFIGGGGFFFMLAVGLWYFRSFKNKRQSRD
ncbi:MAG: hypothetical protein IPG07_18455 [Crocinitomicaceae bacterium]|nr:hypothetical protein [Crocinitomicaceae bacterium]